LVALVPNKDLRGTDHYLVIAKARKRLTVLYGHGNKSLSSIRRGELLG